MKLSEYIEVLERLKYAHGDLEVRAVDYGGVAQLARSPELRHLRVRRGPQPPRFFNPAVEEEERRGEAVVRV